MRYLFTALIERVAYMTMRERSVREIIMIAN